MRAPTKDHEMTKDTRTSATDAAPTADPTTRGARR
jgi:hypothetical protein